MSPGIRKTVQILTSAQMVVEVGCVPGCSSSFQWCSGEDGALSSLCCLFSSFSGDFRYLYFPDVF